MKILLFDMDGVLLTPYGYHRALGATVKWLGAQLGYPDVSLLQEHVHSFEANGVTNEWLASAICLAQLVAGAGSKVDPGVSLAQLVRSPFRDHGRPVPDFVGFFRRMANGHGAGSSHERAKALLPAEVHRFIDEAFSMEGVSQPVQQEHVLGSDLFRSTYSRAPVLHVDGYLARFDRSNLSPELRERILGWFDAPNRHAAIFTNRPGTPPGRVFGTPEAEIGRRLVDLEALPLASGGGVRWLEAQLGRPEGSFNKPHPNHALAAIGIALGLKEVEAFRLAAELTEEGRLDPWWRTVSGAEIWVFEDSAGGLVGMTRAAHLLQENGVRINIRLAGISENPEKQAALRRTGASIYPSLLTALHDVDDFFRS